MEKRALYKHITNKGVELAKYFLTIAAVCFLAIKSPDQTTHLVNMMAAFVLGGSAASRFDIFHRL